jgi:NADPH:quinone reductase-like Zn-dependent oxidoreductase
MQMLADVVGAVGRGELHPVQPRTYPLAAVAEALTDQVERRTVGKSVLLP